MKTNFLVWRKILLGVHTNGVGIRSSLEEKRIEIGIVANYTLDRIDYHIMVPHQFDLALVSVSDLGFSEPTSYREIVNTAQKLGLKLCPGEVGAELCLQYEDMPPKSETGPLIAMRAIESDLGYWHIYYLVINQLQVKRAHQGDKFDPEAQFVFLIPEA